MPPRLLERSLRETLEDGVRALLREHADADLAPPAWLRIFVSSNLIPEPGPPAWTSSAEWMDRERLHLREVAERWAVDQGARLADARLTIDMIAVEQRINLVRVRPPAAWGADAPRATFRVTTAHSPQCSTLHLRGWGVVGRTADGSAAGIGDAFDPGDPSVSRRHALLRVTGGQVAVVDLGSRNGTFVNNRRIGPDTPHRLASGDRVRCGATTLEFVKAR